MTVLPATEELPALAPVPRVRRRWKRWQLSVAAGVAGSLGCAAALFVSDSAVKEGEEGAVTRTARPLPVLSPDNDAGGLSRAVSLYGISEWSADTRALVLGGWGAAFSTLFEAEAPPMSSAGPGIADDPRLGDPAAPAFVDPCAGGTGGGPDPDADTDGCPDGRSRPGVILGAGRLPPNAVVVHPFPQADVRLAAECTFEDVAAGEIPIAVMTANPGRVTVTVGTERATATSSDGEREEWQAWVDRPLGTRPPVTFVAHCLSVPEPGGPGPYPVRAVATDDDDQSAVAEAAIAPLVEGLPPVGLTPLDGTMLRVEVPLPPGSEQATVAAAPLSALAGVADCNALTPAVAAGLGSGWRRGATSVVEPPAGTERPYLRSATRVQRVTLPLPEGEPSLVCVTFGAGPALRRATLVATPPDARRLVLAVRELVIDPATPAGTVEVRGSFAELGWTPCGAALPAPGMTVTDPGFAGVLCVSGGDTGAIADAGGVLDLQLRTGGRATHRARIALSAAPRDGVGAAESYRLPIPAPDLDGVLCTTGVDQPGCVEPTGESVLGTLVVTATWDEGPVGPTIWSITAPTPA